MRKEDIIREAKEWGQSLVVALILTLIIRTYVVQAFKIPSGSMRPTLIEGDKLFVSKLVYRFEEPERGDIIVFKYPVDKKKDFIKRLVAYGGETVEIRDGQILINGEVLEDDETFGQFYYYNHDPYAPDAESIFVPHGTYYVLGDNSASSTDSRYWGFVPEENIVGKAVYRWWPPQRIGRIQ